LIRKRFQNRLHHGGEPSEFAIFLEVAGILSDFSYCDKWFFFDRKNQEIRDCDTFISRKHMALCCTRHLPSLTRVARSPNIGLMLLILIAVPPGLDCCHRESGPYCLQDLHGVFFYDSMFWGVVDKLEVLASGCGFHAAAHGTI
jgi:hypothetical protein